MLYTLHEAGGRGRREARGRRPGAEEGSPRRAAADPASSPTFRLPGSPRPRRAPREGARAPRAASRTTLHANLPLRRLTKKKSYLLPLSRALHTTPPPTHARWRLISRPILRTTPFGRVSTPGSDHHATDRLVSLDRYRLHVKSFCLFVWFKFVKLKLLFVCFSTLRPKPALSRPQIF